MWVICDVGRSQNKGIHRISVHNNTHRNKSQIIVRIFICKRKFNTINRLKSHNTAVVLAHWSSKHLIQMKERQGWRGEKRGGERDGLSFLLVHNLFAHCTLPMISVIHWQPSKLSDNNHQNHLCLLKMYFIPQQPALLGVELWTSERLKVTT